MKSLFFSIASLLTASLSFAQIPSLDNNFGNAGISTITSTKSAEIYCITTDDNGNIFSAGSEAIGQSNGIYHLQVAKTKPNGSLDASFGNNGKAIIAFEESEYPLDIVSLANGKIIVSGSAYTGHTPNGPGVHIGFVVRLQANGHLDSSFAQNGVYKFYTESHFTSIITNTDQSMILIGNINAYGAAVKLEENGTLSSSFGAYGIMHLLDNNFNFVAWRAIRTNDQNIVIAGYEINMITGDDKLAYCKINPSGSFETSFGTDGKTVLNTYADTFSSFDVELLTAVKEAADGSLYFIGANNSPIILKSNANGNVDSSFGTDGIFSHAYPVSDFTLQSDGKIILGGSKQMSDYNYGLSVIRLNADGTADNTYNNGQAFDIDITTDHDHLQSLTYISPDKLILGGSSKPNGIAQSTLVKLNLETSTSIQKVNQATGVDVFPNPFTQTLNIKSEHAAIANIEMYDISGKIVWQAMVNNNTYQLTPMLANGVYWIKINLSNGLHTYKKLVKQ